MESSVLKDKPHSLIVQHLTSNKITKRCQWYYQWQNCFDTFNKKIPSTTADGICFM